MHRTPELTHSDTVRVIDAVGVSGLPEETDIRLGRRGAALVEEV